MTKVSPAATASITFALSLRSSRCAMVLAMDRDCSTLCYGERRAVLLREHVEGGDVSWSDSGEVATIDGGGVDGMARRVIPASRASVTGSATTTPRSGESRRSFGELRPSSDIKSTQHPAECAVGEVVVVRAGDRRLRNGTASFGGLRFSEYVRFV